MRKALLWGILLATAWGCQSEPADPLVGFVPESSASADHPRSDDNHHLTILAHTGCIDSVAFAPDRDEVATCGMDKSLRIWNSKSGEFVRGYTTMSRVTSLAYSSDGKMLAACTQDDGIHLWNTKEWTSQVVARAKGDPDSLAFSPGGEFLAIGARPLQLFRVRDWRAIREREGHDEGGTVVAFSPDGKLLASGNADGFAKVWSAESLRERLKCQHEHWVSSVSFTSDGRHVVTSSFRFAPTTQTLEVTFWDASDGKIAHVLRGDTVRGHLHGDSCFAISPNRRHLVTTFHGHDDSGIVIDDEIQAEEVGSVSLWDQTQNRIVARNDQKKNAYGLAFASDSDKFAVVDVDGNLEIWTLQGFIDEYSVPKQLDPTAPK